ncbi:MAG: hypothetical protein RL368_2442 [Pseudomonadota bacterium]
MHPFYLLISIVLISTTTQSVAENPRYRGDTETTGTIWQTPQTVTATPTVTTDNPKWQISNVTTYPTPDSDPSKSVHYRPLTVPQTVSLPELPRPITPNTDSGLNYPQLPNYPYYGAVNSNNYPAIQIRSENAITSQSINSSDQH